MAANSNWLGPMPILENAADIVPLLPRRARLLGLDLGTKTIGLALSDASRTIATPHETIRRTKFRADAERLTSLIAVQEVGGVVLGLPLNMDGSEGPRCQSTRDFAGNFVACIDLPIAFWDERLSTAAAERLLVSDADLSRRRRAQVIDKVAAALILQSFLNHLKDRGRRC